MKQCTFCNSKKSLDLFNKNKKRKDGLQNICRDCSKKYAKSHYEANKDQEKNRIYSRRQELIDRFNEYKSQLSCTMCGETEVCCLDFHHNDPNDKDFTIAIAAKSGYSWERLLSEIQKCTVVCANCHRKIHAGLLEINYPLV